MKKVVVIGAGITGLSAAYFLHKSMEAGEPVDYLLVEKDHRVGGKIVTNKLDGFTIEGGPDCFLSAKPWVGQIAEQLGIADQIMPSKPASTRTFVWADNRLNELPEGLMGLVPTKLVPFALSPLISWKGKFRMAMELFIPKKKTDEEETLGSFVTRRLGKEALDKIAEPLIGGVHSGDPDFMSLNASFPRFIQMEKEHGSLLKAMLVSRAKTPKPAPLKPGQVPKTFFMTFKEGMGSLTDALVDQLDAKKVLLGCEVNKVERLEDGKYQVTIDGMEPVLADAVIITAPSYEAAKVVDNLDPEMTENLVKIPQATSATVSLGFKRSELTNYLDSYGLLVPLSENRKIHAATFSSSKWNFRTPSEDYVLIRAFVGGARHQELVHLNDEELVNLVLGELKDIMKLKAKPVIYNISRWVKGMPQYNIGHLNRVAAIEARMAANPGLHVVGGSYRGVGVPDCINVGTQAAEKVLAYLKV